MSCEGESRFRGEFGEDDLTESAFAFRKGLALKGAFYRRRRTIKELPTTTIIRPRRSFIADISFQDVFDVPLPYSFLADDD